MKRAKSKKITQAKLSFDDEICLVGHHISKGKKLANEIIDYQTLRNSTAQIKDNIYPVQIFSGSNKGYARKLFTNKEASEINKVISDNNICLTIHGIYIINLARLLVPDSKEFTYLETEFKIGTQIKTNGIVFHVGKSVDLGPELGLANMKENIINIVNQFATESCPFILETPAGQGTELLVSYEDFYDFCNDIVESLSEPKKNCFSVCIDTCHVFAAGHEPSEYLQRWLEESNVEVQIVHFNDSKGECNCHKDRHEEPGIGFIGTESLLKVYSICNNLNIPMVYE